MTLVQFFDEFFHNPYIWTAFLGWFAAQGGKILITLFTEKRLDLTKIMGSGGMPSSHSSLACSLTVKLGRMLGFASPAFSVALILSFIVMYDATGVRQAAGKQAKAINFLLAKNQLEFEEHLKELLGHTPTQVAAGAVLGCVIGWFF